MVELIKLISMRMLGMLGNWTVLQVPPDAGAPITISSKKAAAIMQNFKRNLRCIVGYSLPVNGPNIIFPQAPTLESDYALDFDEARRSGGTRHERT